MDVQMYNMDISGLDLSHFNLTGCVFGSIRNSTNVSEVIFSDAIITKCNFWQSIGLTTEQIKSTWNYKHGRMDGVILPQDIQAALDAEKEGK